MAGRGSRHARKAAPPPRRTKFLLFRLGRDRKSAVPSKTKPAPSKPAASKASVEKTRTAKSSRKPKKEKPAPVKTKPKAVKKSSLKPKAKAKPAPKPATKPKPKPVAVKKAKPAAKSKPAKPVKTAKPAKASKHAAKTPKPAPVRQEPPPPPLKPPAEDASLPPEIVAELTKTVGRRRFRVEHPLRKPTPVSKLTPQGTWDEVIFSIVSNAGKQGITVEDLCGKAIAVKYDKRFVREGAVTPYTRFHNSNIANIEAVCRYLDNPAYRTLYGYRELKR